MHDVAIKFLTNFNATPIPHKIQPQIKYLKKFFEENNLNYTFRSVGLELYGDDKQMTFYVPDFHWTGTQVFFDCSTKTKNLIQLSRLYPQVTLHQFAVSMIDCLVYVNKEIQISKTKITKNPFDTNNEIN